MMQCWRNVYKATGESKTVQERVGQGSQDSAGGELFKTVQERIGKKLLMPQTSQFQKAYGWEPPGRMFKREQSAWKPDANLKYL